jgi:hypothetical protein
MFTRLIAKLIKFILDFWYSIYLAKTTNQICLNTNIEKLETEKAIASLTSFPARINHTYISIECLLRQSVNPDRIILWLAEDQFPNQLNDLP